MKFHKFTFISSSLTGEERFNSRGQHQWKFIGAKEEKSPSIGLAVLLFWNTNMAAVTSWENALYYELSKWPTPSSLISSIGRALQLYHGGDRIESRPFGPEHPRDLHCLTARIRDFKAKWARDSGSKVCRDAGCRKWPSGLRDWGNVSVGITGSRNPCVHFEAQNVSNDNPLKNRSVCDCYCSSLKSRRWQWF